MILWIGEPAIEHRAHLQTSFGTDFQSGSYRHRHGPPQAVDRAIRVAGRITALSRAPRFRLLAKVGFIIPKLAGAEFIWGRPPPAKGVETVFGKMVGCSHMSGPLVRCI